MLNILQKHTVKFVVIAGMLLSSLTIFTPSQVSAAACAAPATDYGTVTQTVHIDATGTYRIWSRMAVPDTTNNTFLLEIDGSTCYTVGGSSSIPASAGLTATPPTGTINWTWVDYQGGNTSSKIQQTLTGGTGSAGDHTFKLIGNKPNVAVDRVIVTQDTTGSSCNPPTGTGDSCANPADTTKPQITSLIPANGATIQATSAVTVTANASDDSGTVSSIVLTIDGTNVKTCTSVTTCTYTWNTSALAAGSSHTVKATATDPAGLTASTTNTVTIQAAAQKSGDTNGDNVVNGIDYNAIYFNWQKTGMTRAQGDLNGDGVVNGIDYNELYFYWGK